MKLNLKIFAGLLVVFGLLFLGFALWEPIHFKYYTWKLDSERRVSQLEAAGELLAMGEKGRKPVYRYYKERYSSKDVKERMAVVDELCDFGDAGKAVMYDIFRERCRFEMVRIPAGSFMMGSENGDDDEKPVHEVTLSGFWMDRYEVTNEKYYVFTSLTSYFKAFVINSNQGIEPSICGCGLEVNYEIQPVTDISWVEAKAYADWLEMELPTEAQWEYACRAGSTTEYCFGDNDSMLGEYAWYEKNSGGNTHPVGEKKPNDWGLYDMHGNAYEWCHDWYREDYYKNSPKNNPTGPSSGSRCVLRGGGWGGLDYNCRSAYRSFNSPDYGFYFGFRLCCSSGP